MFFRKYSKNKCDQHKKNSKEINIDKKEFWLLVKAAYKAILPFVLVIVVVYFLFTLILTKIIIK